jgi:hypothetical protein
MRATLTALLAAALLFPATASAIPGDPPVEAVFPDDGAAVPVDPDGIEVRYTCPAYTVAGEPCNFPLPGGRKDYGVLFASTPATGNDGRLLESDLVAISGPDDVQDNDIPPGQCRAFMADPDNRPQVTPGTYFWQAWRLCLDCPGGYEVSAIRSLRVTAAGSGAGVSIKPPARAYRGFAFVVSVATPGIAAGTPVTLQARRGARWVKVATAAATTAASDVALELPGSFKAGNVVLRATARVGTETLTSRARTLSLRKAKGWSTSGRQDGAWSGKAQNLPVRFRVSGDGRTVKAGRFRILLLCPTPGMVDPFTTQLADAPLTKARIAPDGTFVFAGVVRDHVTFVKGRIRGHHATGTASLSLGTCTGAADFSAHKG